MADPVPGFDLSELEARAEALEEMGLAREGRLVRWALERAEEAIEVW